MSKQVSIKCDECGTTKGETNHWLVIGTNFSLKSDHAGSSMFICNTKEITVFDERYTIYDLCGHECTMKFLSKNMKEL